MNANKEYQRKWYIKNRERLLKKQSDYRKENNDEVRKKDRIRHQKNKEIISIRGSEYRNEHRDEIKERMARYYAENIERISMKNLEYRKENKDSIRKKDKAYRKKNIGELTDSYVLSTLTRGRDLTRSDIPHELIEVKRVILLAKRRIRQ